MSRPLYASFTASILSWKRSKYVVLLKANGTHVLYGNQIRTDKRYMVNLAEHAHDA